MGNIKDNSLGLAKQKFWLHSKAQLCFCRSEGGRAIQETMGTVVLQTLIN
jgi:hypothetical protein